MSVFSEKKGISELISTLISIRDSNLDTDLLNLNFDNPISSNSKDPFLFLIEILIQLVGEEAIKTLFRDLINDKVPNLEEPIKNELKNTLVSYNKEETVSNTLLSGIDIPVKNLDYDNIYKSGNINNYNYDGSSIESKLHNTINSGGSVESFSYLNMKFNPNNETVKVNVTSSIAIGTLLNGLIDQIQIINQDKIIIDVLDLIFGTIRKGNGKTNNQIIEDEEINKLLENLINNDDSGNNDSVFELTDSQLLNIRNKVNDLNNGGLSLDFGCTLKTLNMDEETLLEISKGDKDTLTSKITDYISNNIITDEPDIESIDDSTSNEINQYNQLKNNNDSFRNSEAVSVGIYKNLIKGIVIIVLKNILYSPSMSMIFSLFDFITNPNKLKEINPLDRINLNKNICLCMSKKIRDEFIEFILDIVKKQLLLIITPVILIIIKEKLQQYKNQLKSLIVK